MHFEAIGMSDGNFKKIMHNSPNGLNISHRQIPIFKGENYGFGGIKMKTLFLSHELWDYVENGYIEPEYVENGWIDPSPKRSIKGK